MIEIVGIIALHACMQVFILFSNRSSLAAFCFETVMAEWAILVVLVFGVGLEIISSFIANTTNTTIGIRSPWSSQMSISFRLESSGSAAWTELYKVYMTRFEVRATMIIASKWDSPMNKVTSAAKIRQIEGMKRENQKGPDILSMLMTKLKLLELTVVEQLVTMYLFSVRDMFNWSPQGTSCTWLLSVSVTSSCCKVCTSCNEMMIPNFSFLDV